MKSYIVHKQEQKSGYTFMRIFELGFLLGVICTIFFTFIVQLAALLISEVVNG